MRGLLGLLALLSFAIGLHGQVNYVETSSPPLVFTYEANSGRLPPALPLVLSTTYATGAGLGYAFLATTNDIYSWLSVNPASGTAPATLSVSVNPAGLPPGSFAGQLRFVEGNTGYIPVSLTVTTTSQLLISPPAGLSFTMQAGGQSPQRQYFTIQTSGSPLDFTIAPPETSGGNWLTLDTVSGTTPASVKVLPANGLQPGIYSGSITVTAPNASDSPQMVPVTVTVDKNPRFVADPDPLDFKFVIGGAAPAAQSVTITSTGAGAPMPFSATTTASWLSVTPAAGVTGQALNISATPQNANLAAGNYSGSVVVNGPDAAAPLGIPVTLEVGPSGAPLLIVTPRLVQSSYHGVFGGPQQSDELVSNLSVSTTPLPPNTHATAFIPGNVTQGLDLFAEFIDPFPPFYCFLSQSCDFYYLPPGFIESASVYNFGGNWLLPGTYQGAVTFEFFNGQAYMQDNIPLALDVGPPVALVATPQQVSLQAGTPQTVTLSTTDNVHVPISIATSTQSGGNWLQAVPDYRTAPTSLKIQAAGLPNPLVGTYTGTITITPTGTSNGPQTISVTLVGPAGLTYVSGNAQTGNVGAALPQPLVVKVTASDGSPVSGVAVSFAVTLGSGSLSPAVAATAADGTAATTLTLGSSPGNVVVTASVAGLTAKVTFGAAAIPAFGILAGGIVNAASFAVANGVGAPVSPGSLVAIFTSALAAQAAIFSTASLPDLLGGVSVTFNNIQAPMVQVVPGGAYPFVSVQVPFEVLAAGQASATVPVVITVNNVPSAPVMCQIVASQPGIFTLTANGLGYAVLVNLADDSIAAPSGTASFSHPIPRGQTAFFYVTGLGALTPSVVDGTGSCTAADGLCHANPMPTVSVGGVPATVGFAGQAPGFPGVMQINITVPPTAPTGGNVTLTVTSADGTVTSNAATIAVQ